MLTNFVIFIHSFVASPVPSVPGKPGSPCPFRGSRPGKEIDWNRHCSSCDDSCAPPNWSALGCDIRCGSSSPSGEQTHTTPTEWINEDSSWAAPVIWRRKNKLELTGNLKICNWNRNESLYQDNRNHIEDKFDPSAVHKGDGNRSWPFVMFLVHPRV